MIEAIELEKSFGSLKAVRAVSFRVKRGEVVGLLGPNGAGKTTTFRMIAGTLGPSSGRVKIGGIDLQTDAIKAKELLGYMPENAPLYPELTGREYLSYRAELKRIKRPRRRASVDDASERAGVQQLLGVRIAHLSKGYRQRLALADALLGSPPVLLLDEPTSGLDPNQILEVRRLLRSLAREHAILISTHILSEVEATCSRAVVIHEGQVVGEGSLAELRQRQHGARAQLIVQAQEDKLKRCLGPHFSRGSESDLSIERLSSHEMSQGAEPLLKVEIPLVDSEELALAISLCCRDGLKVLEAVPLRAPLDEVFAHLTARVSPDFKAPSRGPNMSADSEQR